MDAVEHAYFQKLIEEANIDVGAHQQQDEEKAKAKRKRKRPRKKKQSEWPCAASDDDTGGDTGDDDDDMIVAATSRASRAARSPPPSLDAHVEASRDRATIAANFEARKMTLAPRQPVVGGWGKMGRAGLRGEFSGSVARPVAQLSHVFSLQRPIDANVRESSYLTYQSVLPLESFQLAAAGMRSNSVCASLVHKARKTQGGGQQTTRNNLQELAAAFASQSTAVAIALGVAKRRFGRASDPGASIARDVSALVDKRGSRMEGLFVVTSSTRLLPHAMPIRIVSHNLLTTMHDFATSELDVGAIRSLVPQQVESLKLICTKIVDKADGVSVWAAWVLLVHMLSDPRLRKLVRASPIADHEVAAAYLFTNYARAEVTRRARMDQQLEEKRKKESPASAAHGAAQSKAERVQLAEAGELQAQLDEQERTNKQTLSLKRKRPPCSGVVQVSGGVLDYWAAALSSEYSSILKLMITQSKALANAASVQTLTGQAPPGFNSERNALLVDISARNAVRRAAALSGLVVTTSERVPKIVTWRCRDRNGVAKMHTGMVRSTQDASNTTVHATRMPRERLQEPSGHTVTLWSLAVRNATPHDATSSLVPGIVEGALYQHALETDSVQLRTKHYKERVLVATKQWTQRSACDGSLDVALTGVARSFLVMRAKLVVGESQVLAGKHISEQLERAHAAAQESAHSVPLGDCQAVDIASEEALGGMAEPFATPSNNLALALEANEQMRVLFKSKSHRGDPCRHLVGTVTSTEMAEASCEEHDRPQSLLPIVDCKVDALDDALEDMPVLPNRRDARLATVAITLTVCGDSPIRLPELLNLFARECRPRAQAKREFEIVSLLCGGAARASELNDVATSITAGAVNSAIGSAKRILVGDLNMRLFCTLHQVYRVGTSNVPRSFETTPWSGVYGAANELSYSILHCPDMPTHPTLKTHTHTHTCSGAGFDIGTSGAIGIRASSVTADKRCVLLETHTHRVTFCHPGQRSGRRRPRGPRGPRGPCCLSGRRRSRRRAR